MIKQHFLDGNYVFSEGDESDYAYFINSALVEVVISSDSKEEVVAELSAFALNLL